MTTHTTIKSWGSLALGLFFTGITARTIFDDVWNGAAFTVGHLNAIGALVAAIAAGHLAWPLLKQKRIPAALGLALIFVASTGYIVTSAGARNAEVSNHKAALILKNNEERAALKAKITEAEADVDDAKRQYDAAKDAAAKECGTGKATRCAGKEATRDWAAKDVEKAESFASLNRGKLSLLGPEEQPFAGYRHAAKVFEAAGMGNAGVIEARLELLLPFVLVLISELGTLVFLGMALGQKPTVEKSSEVAKTERPKIIVSEAPAPVAPEAEFAARKSASLAMNDNITDLELAAVAKLFRGDIEPVDPNGGGKVVRPRRWHRDEVRADLTTKLERGESFPSQRAMAAIYGVPTSTLSEWFSAWIDEGMEVNRTQIGRRKVVG